MMALWTQDVPPGVGLADIDHKGGAAQATEHLLSLGHTKIAFFGPGKDGPNAHFSLRHQGYLSALHKAGLKPDPELHTEDPQNIIQLHRAGRVTGVVGVPGDRRSFERPTSPFGLSLSKPLREWAFRQAQSDRRWRARPFDRLKARISGQGAWTTRSPSSACAAA